MPTNPNMVAIQTVTVGAGGASSISFTSIPQTYTDLKLVLSVRDGFAGVADDMLLTLNGSTTGFSNRYIYGNGSSVFSGTAYGNLVGNPVGSTATSNTFSNIEIYFPNYTSANQKSYSVDSVSENNATEAYAFMIAGRNTTTSAITSLSVAGGSNFAQYSTATLFGVTSAGYGAKATGGIITQDANYYYHTFLASGTFTPTQSITADCLVIAGGGGSSYPGGGGAGGVIAFASQSLANGTGYTVTVGGGGSAGVSTTFQGTQGSNSQFASLTAAVGGGRGGAQPATKTGGDGGSGGGASFPDSGTGTEAGGLGTSGQGFAGGTGQRLGGGGGGGAGAVGQAANASGSNQGGTGGIGTNSVTNWGALSAVLTATGSGAGGYLAGGGGGASWAAYNAAGGTGGGGTGSSNASTTGMTAGTTNTGGGGGGGVSGATAGGSGIVIVRYAK